MAKNLVSSLKKKKKMRSTSARVLVAGCLLALFCARIMTVQSTYTDEHISFAGNGTTICAFGVCQYQGACYDVMANVWQTQNSANTSPMLNDLGNFVRASDPNAFESRHSRCNGNFISVLKPERPNDYINVPGTTYNVCCWVTHFGHVLINMLIPAFHALQTFGLQDQIPNMTYLLDLRYTYKWGSNDTIIEVFELATASRDRVLTLPDLIQKAREEKKTHVCFERFVVGMRHDTLLVGLDHPGHPAGPDATSGMLEALRDEMSRLYPRPNSGQQTCRVLILDRQKTRVINDVGSLMRLSSSIFRGNVLVSVDIFDYASLIAQYKQITETHVLITVAGTGSHWAIFLPEGAASIVIKASGNVDVNFNLCMVANHVKCFNVNSTSDDDTKN